MTIESIISQANSSHEELKEHLKESLALSVSLLEAALSHGATVEFFTYDRASVTLGKGDDAVSFCVSNQGNFWELGWI